MPRINLMDVSNTTFMIDSGNWETILEWADEWLPLLHHENLPLKIVIQPLFLPDPDGVTNSPDWPANTRYFGPYLIPKEFVTGKEFVDWMSRQRNWIEEQIKGLTDE